MAIISCPECHKRVSEFADKCPSCGYSISKADVELSKSAEAALGSAAVKIIGVIVVIIVVFIVITIITTS